MQVARQAAGWQPAPPVRLRLTPPSMSRWRPHRRWAGTAARRAVPSVGCYEQSAVEGRREVLVYTSGPLSEDTLVAGPIAAQLTVAASSTDCDWIIRLCDVNEAGSSLNVTQGAQRSRFRNSFTTAEPLSPNSATVVRVGMRQCGHLFRKGHRIRLVVAGSSFPHYGRNPGVCEPVTALPASAYRSVVQYLLHGADQRSWLELRCVPLESSEPWSPPQSAAR